MTTPPIDPMRNWRLEELQKTLNKMEGYEKVVIEFSYTPSIDTSKPSWDCQCGIKELSKEGKWKWLLRTKFVMDDYMQTNLKIKMWEEAAERLVLEIWRRSIDSLRKESQQIDQMLSSNHLRRLNLQPLNDKDLKLIDEIDERYRSLEKERKRKRLNIITWLKASGIVLGVLFIIFLLLKFQLARDIGGYILFLAVIGFFIFGVKIYIQDND